MSSESPRSFRPVPSAQRRRPPREPARRAGLRYVHASTPGIRRLRCGRGFRYLDPAGRPVRDAATLQRIRRLAIPPAYHDVWICTDPLGHLQATGRDARGRKQYRYHPGWRERCERDKFGRLVAFGRALPRLRRRLSADLARPRLPREKVLALVISVLADTLLRIGSREYARENRSYGLTTLRSRHVRIERGRARFRFRGKRGQDIVTHIDDPRLIRLIDRCQHLPGQELFQFIDDAGEAQPIDSSMVNDYLREAMGDAFTAKDFRTWGGTLAALLAFAATPLPARRSERALATRRNTVIAGIAQLLRNTPAVCRRSYVHPAVHGLWRDGTLHELAAQMRLDSRHACERFALRALQSTHAGD